MRITHVIPALTLGGAEQVVIDLANHGVAAGHDVTVATAGGSRHGVADRLDPAVRHRILLDDATLLRRYAGLPWIVARSWPWLREQDVLHCHLTFAQAFGATALLARAARRGTRSPRLPRVVETYHAVGAPMAAWRRFVAAGIAARLDGFALMADDPYWRAFRARHPDLPTAVIANGIDIGSAVPGGSRDDARRAWGLPVDRRLIGTVGRLVAERRPFDMLRALAAAALRYDDVDVVMGGDGPELSALRAEGERLGLGDRLHLPGRIREPRRLMAEMEVYLSLNIGATTGIAGLEAAATGVAVVALQGTSGRTRATRDWIWSDTDPAAVGLELSRLLDDDAARSLLARQQRAHVASNHDAASMFDAYMDLYRRAGVRAPD